MDVSTRPDRVDLALDGIVLGELVSPYEYVWRTGALPDGEYTFTARVTANAREVVSEPLRVHLDRVAPTASISPPAGAILSPPWPDVTITFDEPLDRAPFDPAAAEMVLLPDGSPAQGWVASLDGDDRTVRFTPTGSPTSGPVEARVAGLRDPAQNPAAPISLAYRSTHSRVLASGTDQLGWPQVAFDNAGRWVAAFLQGADVRVFRGDPLSLVSPIEALVGIGARPQGNSFSLALDATDAPVLATASGDGIQLWRWSGEAWAKLGPPAPEARWSVTPALKIDWLGRAVVAWSTLTRLDPPPSNRAWHVVRAARFDGTAWEDLGALHDEARTGSWPSLVLYHDIPYVSYWDGTTTDAPTPVRYWDDAGWAFSGEIAQWGYPLLAATGLDHFIAVTDHASTAVFGVPGGVRIDDTVPVSFHPGEKSVAFEVPGLGPAVLAWVSDVDGIAYRILPLGEPGGTTFHPPMVDPAGQARAPALGLWNLTDDQRFMALAWSEQGADGQQLLALDFFSR